MAISRWEPFNELMPLRDMMNRLMEESFIMPRTFGRAGEMVMQFPVDIMETENDVIVKAAMPGMRPEDVDVRITENVLTIKGEYREEHEYGQPPKTTTQPQQQQQGRATAREEAPVPTWYRREISRGSCYRELTLPTMVQADKAQATFENGVLMLTLPKAEEAKARRIPVQGKAGQSGQPRLQTR